MASTQVNILSFRSGLLREERLVIQPEQISHLALQAIPQRKCRPDPHEMQGAAKPFNPQPLRKLVAPTPYFLFSLFVSATDLSA